jgi:hypothetical protein
MTQPLRADQPVLRTGTNMMNGDLYKWLARLAADVENAGNVDSTLFVNLSDYAADADGDDWTVPVQTVLDLCSADSTGDGATSLIIYASPRTYEISETLTLIGKAGVSIHFYGGVASETDGTTFLWTGADGGVPFHFRGVCDSIFERIRFDGNESALYAFRMEYLRRCRHQWIGA